MLATPDIAGIAGVALEWLAADALLQRHMGRPCRVYAATPHEPVYPFATLRTATDPAGRGAFSLTSVHRSHAEAKEITPMIRDRLNEASFILATGEAIRIRATFWDVLRGADYRSVYGVIRLVVEPMPGGLARAA